MLLAYPGGGTVSAIAGQMRTNRPKVERCIDKALTLGTLGALRDLPGSGKPPKITPEDRARIMSLACRKPKDLGYPHEVGTTALLAEHVRRDQRGPSECENCVADGEWRDHGGDDHRRRHGWRGTMTLKGDSNLTIVTPGKVGTVTLTSTLAHPIRLSGIFDVRILSSLTGANANPDGLKVRATEGVGTVNVRSVANSLFSAGTIGNVTTSRDMTGSMVLAGYDIGTDMEFDPHNPGHDGAFTWVKGNVGAVLIGGSMSASCIAANVAPGADGWFGNGDVVLAESLEGAIKSLTVKGALIGSANASEHFGVVAHRSLGSLKVGATVYKSPWPVFGNLTVKDTMT